MDDEREHPPPLGRGRREPNRRRFEDSSGSTTKSHEPQVTTVTVVDVCIGRTRVVLRTERYIYDPDIWRYELWPYKTGPRKGQRRWVRVRGGHRNRRISVRRYREATLAVHACRATRRALGLDSAAY